MRMIRNKIFSSVFDETGEFLEKLNVKYTKYFFENNHYPLLKKIAQTKTSIVTAFQIYQILKVS